MRQSVNGQEGTGSGGGGVRLLQGRGTAGLNAWARGAMEKNFGIATARMERVGGWGANEREETEEARW